MPPRSGWAGEASDEDVWGGVGASGQSSELAVSAHPGLYLHIPFCSAICPYCDFAVLTGGPEKRRRVGDYLISEHSLGGPDRPGLEGTDTLFFRRGTPTAAA